MGFFLPNPNPHPTNQKNKEKNEDSVSDVELLGGKILAT